MFSIVNLCLSSVGQCKSGVVYCYTAFIGSNWIIYSLVIQFEYEKSQRMQNFLIKITVSSTRGDGVNASTT